MMLLGQSPNTFLGMPPEWSLAGLQIKMLDGSDVRVDQQPFQWCQGVWEAEVIATTDDRADRLPIPGRIMVRVSPETLRRWKEAGIDPLREAFAQLQEHILRRLSLGELSLLTLL